jgi:hypothetical protein
MATWLSPYLGASIGGYLIAGSADADGGKLRWAWSGRARLGVRSLLGVETPKVNLRLFVERVWSETNGQDRAVVFSGWGMGLTLMYLFEVPAIDLVRKVTHGDGMPRGW